MSVATSNPATVLLAVLMLAGVAVAAEQGGSSASQPTSAANSAKYPNIQMKEEGGTTRVFWDDKLIVEIKDNRFMRFRATPADENWVGAERSPADMGWAYRDSGVKGLIVLSATRQNEPEKGRFVVNISGKKPQFDSHVDIELVGTWMPQVGKFKYTLWTRFGCSLEDWYKNSKFAQRGLAVNGGSALWTEAIDYCIEGISMTERLNAPNKAEHAMPPMYEWFVKSSDGQAWQKWPKVHIPYPVRPGSYLTIRDLAHPAGVGEYYGFVDKAAGGWMTRIEKASAPIVFEICWALFDVHVELQGAIPPPGSVKDLSLEVKLAFEPVEAAKGREIVAAAKELPWREAREYRLPLFSWDDRFDKLLTDLPSEQTALHHVWWPSSYECDRDDRVGFDDSYSLTINRTKASAKPAAWTIHSWSEPFTTHPRKGRQFRFSAMVKTADCTGSVRIGQFHPTEKSADVYYGGRTHKSDGSPVTDGIVWEYSKALTGTTDWTPLSFEFTGTIPAQTLLLEQTGTGQCWFDNVKIEDIGPAVATQKSKN